MSIHFVFNATQSKSDDDVEKAVVVFLLVLLTISIKLKMSVEGLICISGYLIMKDNIKLTSLVTLCFIYICITPDPCLSVAQCCS